jgi:hypothetical protein
MSVHRNAALTLVKRRQLVAIVAAGCRHLRRSCVPSELRHRAIGFDEASTRAALACGVRKGGDTGRC